MEVVIQYAAGIVFTWYRPVKIFKIKKKRVKLIKTTKPPRLSAKKQKKAPAKVNDSQYL